MKTPEEKDKPVTIHDLLGMVPAESLRVQFLHEGDLQAQNTKHGTRLSFYTGIGSPVSFANDTAPIGVVVWIPRADWKRIVETVNHKKGTQ